jgi:hypothetical protein
LIIQQKTDGSAGRGPENENHREENGMRRTGMTVFLIMLLTALCAAAGAEESRFRPKDLLISGNDEKKRSWNHRFY